MIIGGAWGRQLKTKDNVLTNVICYIYIKYAELRRHYGKENWRSHFININTVPSNTVIGFTEFVPGNRVRKIAFLVRKRIRKIEFYGQVYQKNSFGSKKSIFTISYKKLCLNKFSPDFHPANSRSLFRGISRRWWQKKRKNRIGKFVYTKACSSCLMSDSLLYCQ